MSNVNRVWGYTISCAFCIADISTSISGAHADKSLTLKEEGKSL
jgi:hypothetical protein